MKVSVSIYPDKRYKTSWIRFVMQLSWSEEHGKYRKLRRNLPESYSVIREHYNFKRRTIANNSLEATVVRDRHSKLKDFVRHLPYNMPFQEKLDAIATFLQRPIIGELKHAPQELSALTDLILQYAILHKMRFGYNSIRKYVTLARNIQLFIAKSEMTDNLSLLTYDQQVVFFSKYIDFLLHERIESVKLDRKVIGPDDKIVVEQTTESKAAYENDSAREDFKLLKAVTNKFKNSGLLVNLNDFTKDLKKTRSEMPYPTLEEVKALYHFASTEALSREEEIVADTSIFQAFTGLRYSELYQVEDVNITTRINPTGSFLVLNIVQSKTGKATAIPLNDVCLAIIEKWRARKFDPPKLRDPKHRTNNWFPNCLLPLLTINECNKTLHTLLKRIPAFQRIEKRIRFRGSERIEENIARHALICTHSFRHFFSSHLLRQGISVDSIGHLINSPRVARKHYEHHDREQLLELANRALQISQ